VSCQWDHLKQLCPKNERAKENFRSVTVMQKFGFKGNKLVYCKNKEEIFMLHQDCSIPAYNYLAYILCLKRSAFIFKYDGARTLAS
jgi:hypothetical protein